MAVKREQFIPDRLPQRSSPIQYATENGFSIIRLCDVDESVSAIGAIHPFLVRDPDGYELEFTVEISKDAIDAIGERFRDRISHDSSFWITLAERHLATYLWENDDYPPDSGLKVEELTPDDFLLALRWECDT